MATDSPGRKKARADAEAAFAEHREIARMLCETEAWLDEPVGAARRWSASLRARLEPLRRALGPHFRGEEESSLYRDVPIEFPRFARPLERLFAEHGEIKEEVGRIVDSLSEDAEPEIARARELTLHTKRLIFTLRRHESEENEILQQAYWDDLAGGE